MSIVVDNDITVSNCDYICHQVNCQGVMNSGVAKAIRNKWPQVYENYMAKFKATKDIPYQWFLGDIQFVPLYDDYYKDVKKQSVINMFAQDAYGYDGKRYTSYDAFWICLNMINQSIPKGCSIAFPYNIGCDRGGANWHIIKTMIEEVLDNDHTVIFYKWEGK